jgi:predicted RNA-binding Zn-ribbon protein involved in translation (DUF1610 family)
MSNVRRHMVRLPNPGTARIQALLGASVSWLFILWVVGLPFFASRTYVIGGLIVLATLVFLVIAVSLALKCPRCGRNIALVSNAPRLAPDWQAARRQFFPTDALLGMPTSSVCPHCGVEISIRLGLASDV